MIGWLSIEQVLASVAVNVIGLVAVQLMRSAPPRVVLYVCLSVMLAIVMPWGSIGVAPLDIGHGLTGQGNPQGLSTFAPSEAVQSQTVLTLLGYVWVCVGILWLLLTVGRSLFVIRRNQSRSTSDASLAAFADPTFTARLKRVDIRRMPGSDVYTTGVFHPQIWIGAEISQDAQLRAALNHELCHLAFRDHWTLPLVVSLERLLWWNPLIWLLGRQARRQMEFACDARCQSLMGTNNYRRSLAELSLLSNRKSAVLMTGFGDSSSIINRMERMGMNYSFKLRHGFMLGISSLLALGVASNISADESPRPTLIECHDLLPRGVQYDFRIVSEIDTREGQTGEMGITLLDRAKPDDRGIPAGADQFVECVKQVVGVEDNGQKSDA